MVTQYGGRPPIPAVGPTSLLAPSLDLDMSIFPSRKFEEQSLGSCSDHMVPAAVPFIPENANFVGGAGGGILILQEEEKSVAMELAISSVEVLIKMCQMGEPLWIPTNDVVANAAGKEILNVEEYSRMFPPWSPEASGNHHHHHHLKQQHNPGHEIMLVTEATRHSCVIIMNSITLVDAFLDAVSPSPSHSN